MIGEEHFFIGDNKIENLGVLVDGKLVGIDIPTGIFFKDFGNFQFGFDIVFEYDVEFEVARILLH